MNGSPASVFETDEDRRYFLVRFPVHPNAMRAAVAGDVATQVAPQVEELLAAIQSKMERDQLQTALGLKARKNFRQAYLMPDLDAGFIEMTQPDSPRSPTQKYRLKPEGVQLLQSMAKE